MPVSDAARVFDALADTTRRTILETLSVEGFGTATQLASELDITRQAVAKHLVILADAGLAASEKVGRETRYQPTLNNLDEVNAWVHQVQQDWQHRLARLATSLEQ